MFDKFEVEFRKNIFSPTKYLKNLDTSYSFGNDLELPP